MQTHTPAHRGTRGEWGGWFEPPPPRVFVSLRYFEKNLPFIIDSVLCRLQDDVNVMVVHVQMELLGASDIIQHGGFFFHYIFRFFPKI